MNLTLAISHNVFLTKNQRDAIFAGKTLDVVGVNVPIWYGSGKTSEPGNEVFCRYSLIPTKHEVYIKHTTKGTYEVQLPISSYNPDTKTENPVVLKSLLDYKDGGSKWLAFKQFSKIKKAKNNVQMAHFLEIKDIEELMQSML